MKSLLAIFLLGLFSCQNHQSKKHRVQISGVVRHTENSLILLNRLTPEGYQTVDSSILDKGNRFEFSVLSDINGAIFQIDVFGKQEVIFVVDTADLSIAAVGSDSLAPFQIRGSDAADAITMASEIVTDHTRRSAEFKNLMSHAQDSSSLVAWEDSLSMSKKYFSDHMMDIIRKQRGSLAGLLLLTHYFSLEQHLAFFEEQMPLFATNLDNHDIFQQIQNEFNNFRRLAVGAMAPNFQLPTPESSHVSLSDFRGSYVLIEFWGSWCLPCRLENPKLVEVYNKFSESGFEVIGVSLERNRDNWLKAIHDDSLPWVHVSDLQYFDSPMIELYDIGGVPMNYLLNPDGTIIAKSISAKQLETILMERL
jgi:peroxiredoxin